MATYTGTKHIPNDVSTDALFAVHCLGAKEIITEGERTRYVLHGKTYRTYYRGIRSGYQILPLWHIAPDRIIEDYDLVDVRIKQTAGGWVFGKDAVQIRTHFSEYDQSGRIPSCHHARQKLAALAHGLLLIALALKGVDVTRRE